MQGWERILNPQPIIDVNEVSRYKSIRCGTVTDSTKTDI